MKTKALLPILLILSIITTLPILKANPAKQRVYVDPKDNVFATTTSPVGTSFTVSIKVAEWTAPAVFSYELKLFYNNTLLNATDAGLPTDHWLKPVSPTKIYVVDAGTINQTLGFVSFAATLLTPEVGKTGSGTISTVTFKIIQAPTAGNLSCTLELRDVIMVDTEANEISKDQYDIINGNYVYMGAPPPPVQKAQVYVDPKGNTFSNSTTPVGTNFTISIKAVNWTTPGVFGYAFKLYYDKTLLQAVDAQIPTDHWLKPSNPSNITIADPGTINQTSGFVSFNATLLSGEQGKVGGGTISTVTFNITQAPPAGGNVSCLLEIKSITLLDPSGAQITTDKYDVVNGNYLYSAAPTTKKEDLDGDGKINIKDIAVWGMAFGSYPGHPRWSAAADINGDGKVDMIDAVLICKVWTG